MGNGSRFSPEVKERAVRLVLDQVKSNEPTWPAIVSVATKIGCTAETLRRWVRQAERDSGLMFLIYHSSRRKVMKKRICLVGLALLLALVSAYSQAVSLFSIIYGGSPEDIQAAINKGAKVNATRSEGTPLILAAAYNKNPEVITVLIKAGADLNARDPNYGATALHWAATYNPNPDVISALLEAGAAINARNTREDMTPLIWAAVKTTNPEIILRLLKAGADATLRVKDGKSALDYAKANEKLNGTDALTELEKASH